VTHIFFAPKIHKPIRIISRSAKAGVRRFTVSSSSSSGTYKVVNTKSQWTCSCKGWIYPRKVERPDGTTFRVRQNCQHIKFLLAGSRGK